MAALDGVTVLSPSANAAKAPPPIRKQTAVVRAQPGGAGNSHGRATSETSPKRSKVKNIGGTAISARMILLITNWSAHITQTKTTREKSLIFIRPDVPTT